MSTSDRTSLSYAEQLWTVFRVSGPAIRRAVRSAGLAGGSHGLDAGCGAGCHLGLLAREVGPTGRVTALDILPENLAAARAALAGVTPAPTPAARQTGAAAVAGTAAVDFVQGDIRRLPFEDGSFDWVWCADALWPGVVIDDPVAVVREFKRVTRPGGKVYLLYWSGQSLLTGYPILEARLNAAFAETVPYFAGAAAEAHYMRAQTWMRQAGLRRPRARTFLTEVGPPADTAMRESLAACYAMFWGELEGRVCSADWADYQRLCLPESSDFVGDTPDYYAFLTYTRFSATR